MASVSSDPRRGCGTGKVESPVADATTGQQSNDSTLTGSIFSTNNSAVPITVTDSEFVKQLQNQVTELQEQVKSLEGKLNYARKQKKELVEEVTELTQENSGFKNGERHQRILGELRQAQFEVEGLRQENQELQNKLQIVIQELPIEANELPIEAARARTLNKLKVGKQSAAGKAIEAFIKEIIRDGRTV